MHRQPIANIAAGDDDNDGDGNDGDDDYYAAWSDDDCDDAASTDHHDGPCHCGCSSVKPLRLLMLVMMVAVDDADDRRAGDAEAGGDDQDTVGAGDDAAENYGGPGPRAPDSYTLFSQKTSTYGHIDVSTLNRKL